ncbi:flagellar filament capping protein FliD [Bacillus sp. ISL-18]|uniref:flagellar filament capping protein FliD n=1 Tax=Bacillus sp. ISL-18 TaxID=2819118 RepID=UPI001BE900EF|nr:flagellar filament capping protein FliD [Bacillus sp. ISL-18]MBT2657811.1 flagellar filament capping protein FliD [Bacillus sp. ISL-18]
MASVNLTTHVSGLASGMDTESIVSGLMKANRVPLVKLQQAKQINTWKTDAYREINTKIASFRDAMQDLRLEGTFNAQKVTSSSSSVDVSMAGTSTLKNFSITEATQAKPAMGGLVSFGTTLNGTDPIFSKDQTPSDIEFKLNGYTVKIPSSSTYDQAIAAINSMSTSTNVKAANVGGSLVLSTTGTGKDNSITISGYTGNASLLNIKEGTTTTTPKTLSDGTSTTSVSLFDQGTFTDGLDAVPGSVVINGTKINISTNTFTFDGVQINLKANITNTDPVAINTVSDTDKVFDKIKTFVDKYNELITDLNSKLSETKYHDYPPLTDDQKKDMKDEDIKLWEDKAKSGLLANDPTIRQFLTQIRSSLSEAVGGANSSFDSLAEIGITTSTYYKDNGKLTLDEAKLKSLLNSNLADVQALFSKKYDTKIASDTTVTSTTKYKNSGFGVRLYDRINDSLSKLTTIAGTAGTISLTSNLAKEATSLNERISSMQDRLDTQEQSLWTKFNAMESALQKLNTQSSWLTQQLG